MGIHEGGKSGSSASRGGERERFVEQFLRNIFPPPFRFGSGDITDRHNERSGQIDVVVEYPFLPSFPIVSTDQARLYMAEGVAAAIEVKSNVADQWSEVIAVHRKLAPLRRDFGITATLGREPKEGVPHFAVGYKGWKSLETLQRKIDESGLDGILVIETGFFASGPAFGCASGTGCLALFAFVCCIHEAISGLKLTSANPYDYGK
jgi:hypothetical protein